MNQPNPDKITLYTSSWCVHSMSVDRFLRRNNVEVARISIDSDPEARQDLIRINAGYASVPTLIFPDGTKLTEPSLSELSRKLNLEPTSGLISTIRGLFSRKGESEAGE